MAKSGSLNHGMAEARFFAAMAAGRSDGLFFAGDLGQRIFQQPFSWKALGRDVRGRSFTLRINYRTSHQIRLHADRLLPTTVSDVDGNAEGRRGTLSMFDGPPPLVVACTDTVTHKHSCDRLRFSAVAQHGLPESILGILHR